MIAVGSVSTGSNYPHLPLTHKHLTALSDETRGISEFARGTKPENKRFCVEDTARALVAVLKMHKILPDQGTARLSRQYLDSIVGLQRKDGSIHFGYDNQGKPLPNLAKGDQVGRVLWGLGHASIYGLDQEMREQAQAIFIELLPHLKRKANGPLPQSYAIQGLHLFLKAKLKSSVANQALIDCANHLLSRMPNEHNGSWKWPNRVVTYDSARFPLALLLAFETTGNTGYRDAGLRVLNFLTKINFPNDGRTLHIIGNQGWYRQGKPPAQFDQQPVDASSLVEASLAARRITKDELWKDRARTAFSWFTGNNVLNMAIYDAKSGGCRDGLSRGSVNQNQGAESTISFWIARCEIETIGIQ